MCSKLIGGGLAANSIEVEFVDTKTFQLTSFRKSLVIGILFQCVCRYCVCKNIFNKKNCINNCFFSLLEFSTQQMNESFILHLQERDNNTYTCHMLSVNEFIPAVKTKWNIQPEERRKEEEEEEEKIPPQ